MKDHVAITIKITHPANRIRVFRGSALRGGKWVDKIEAFYLRARTVQNLFDYGFAKKGGMVNILLNGKSVVLAQVSTGRIAKFYST